MPTKFCIDCGYPLNDVKTRRCPECGRPYSPNQKRTYEVVQLGTLAKWLTRWPLFQIAILSIIPLIILYYYLGWEMYFWVNSWSATSQIEGMAMAFSIASQ